MDLRTRVRKIVEHKWLVFVLCCVPIVWIGADALRHNLSADPIKEVEHRTGDWTLRLLLVTLAITPLVKMSGWNWPRRTRRMLGLFTFFYGVSHLVIYFGLDQAWFFGQIDLGDLKKDLFDRKYIIAGMTALLLMLPLAITSTDNWVRRLGGERWRMLHRLIYLAAIAGVIHYWWLVKASHVRPAIYGSIVLALLAIRAAFALSGGRRAASRSTAPSSESA